jgi:flavin-dependent dehydrogenase
VEHFDVAIVGAGPAGSSSAISLGRKGYSVVLIDKRLFPREKLCGDFLSPINWPLFERLRIREHILFLKPERIASFRISTFFGQEVTLPFPVQNGQPSFGLGLRRSVLDKLLMEKAEQEGVVIKQGFKPSGLKQEKNGWSIMLANPSPEQRLHATLLIGADGRNSWVAHRLGLIQLNPRLEGYLAFQAHLRSAQGDEGKVQIHIFPGGYAGLVRVGGDITNLCFAVERELVRKHRSIEALMERCLSKNPFLHESLKGSEIVGQPLSASPVYFSPRRCYGTGFLLAGDAARVTEPVTGEGVYFALKGGELAAEAADLAFKRNDFSARQLSCYERLSRRAFSRRQRINRLIRLLIYRPALLTPLIRLCSKTYLPLSPLMKFVCKSEASFPSRFFSQT